MKYCVSNDLDEILHLVGGKGVGQRLPTGLVEYAKAASKYGFETITFAVQIADPECGRDIRAEFGLEMQQALGQIIDIAGFDRPGSRLAIFNLFCCSGFAHVGSSCKEAAVF